MPVHSLPVHSNVEAIYRGLPDGGPDLACPFIVTPAVSAGFPSPAADYIEDILDLKDLLVRNPSATFYVRIDGDSMIDKGLFHGDVAVVDRSLTPRSGRVVIGVFDGEVYIKTLRMKAGVMELHSENAAKADAYKPLRATEGHGCEIWGVVTHGIRCL